MRWAEGSESLCERAKKMVDKFNKTDNIESVIHNVLTQSNQKMGSV